MAVRRDKTRSTSDVIAFALVSEYRTQRDPTAASCPNFGHEHHHAGGHRTVVTGRPDAALRGAGWCFGDAASPLG